MKPGLRSLTIARPATLVAQRTIPGFIADNHTSGSLAEWPEIVL